MGAANSAALYARLEEWTTRLSRAFLCSLRERWSQLSAQSQNATMHAVHGVCEAAQYSASQHSPSGAGLVALVVLVCVGAIALACLLLALVLRRRRAASSEPSSAPLAAPSRLAPAASFEPSSPTSSETDSPRPLRPALRRTSAVLAAARAREQAAAAIAASAAVRPNIDGGSMSPYDQWQAQQGLAGRTLSFALYCRSAAEDSDDDDPQGPQAPDTALITLHDELGRGRYGEVLAASWQRRGAITVKALTAPGLKRSIDLKRIAALRHPHLLRLLGVASSPEAPLLLLLPRSARGSLAALLRADAGAGTASRLSWPHRAAIAAGVASGLAYLHAQQPPFAHGDPKCENVIVFGGDDDLTPRLSDAGLLACRPGGVFAAGTPLYAPPEAAEGLAPPADLLAADVYAFGSAILHQLAHAGVAAAKAFSSPLYRAVYAAFEESAALAASAEGSATSTLKWDPLQVQFARSQAGWMPEVAPECPAAMAAAIASCCAAGPAARPTAEELRAETAAWKTNAHDW